MRCHIFSRQSLSSRALQLRIDRMVCARITSGLDNRERERLLMKVRLLRPDLSFGRSRRRVSAGPSAVAGNR